MPQPPEKVEALVCILNQEGSIVGPDKILCEMYTKVLKAGDHFHGDSPDRQEWRGVSAPSEIHSHLLCFVDFHAEIVIPALSGVFFFSALAASRHCCVFCKLHSMTTLTFFSVVIGQQGGWEGTHTTALRKSFCALKL